MKLNKGVVVIEGHVQGLSNTRAFGEAGIPVFVVDINNCLARYSKYCVKFFLCPTYSEKEFINFLIELAIKEKLEDWTLMPSNDHIIENISNNLKLITQYYKTLIPDPLLLDNIINKRKLIDVAISCNLPVPVTLYPDNVLASIENISYPVLIKGTRGLSFYKAVHVKAIQVNSAKMLKKLLPEITSKVSKDNVMIQELIPYDPNYKVVSFTAFCIKGDIKAFWVGEKIREHPIKYGTATFSRSVVSDICREQSITLLAATKYTGICEVEFLYDPRDEQYKLIEINPRTWLWVGLAKACGVNYALMAYNYLNNIDSEYPTSYRHNIYWINYFTDMVFSIKAIFNGNIYTR